MLQHADATTMHNHEIVVEPESNINISKCSISGRDWNRCVPMGIDLDVWIAVRYIYAKCR